LSHGDGRSHRGARLFRDGSVKNSERVTAETPHAAAFGLPQGLPLDTVPLDTLGT